MKKKSFLSTLLICVGIIIFSYPLIAKGYTYYNQKILMEEYEKIMFEYMNQQGRTEVIEDVVTEDESPENEVLLDDDVLLDDVVNNYDDDVFENEMYENTETTNDETSNNNEAIADVNTIIKSLEESSKASQSNSEKSSEVNDYLRKQEIIGLIDISKINVKMIVVEGTEWDNIRVTIGHMKQTKKFGQIGNCALAGHRGGTYGTFFKHIDELEVGDEIVLTDLKGITYKYYVYDKFVTEPTDMDVIKDVKDEKTLTLISCENNGTERLIVHAKMD